MLSPFDAEIIDDGVHYRAMHTLRNIWDIRALRRHAQAYAVLFGWSESGLFAALADGQPKTAQQLPGDERAIRATAPILAQLGILGGDGERWALTQMGLQLLEQGDLELALARRELEDLAQVAHVLQHGGPAVGPDGRSRVADGEDDAQASRAFQAMVHRRSAQAAQAVARRFSPLLRPGATAGPVTVLDLGGGHGRYAAALAERGLTVTVFDRAPCVAFAREHYGDSLSYLAGDFTSDDLGGPYDGVLMSDIIHNFGPDDNRALLRRVYDALKPGGLLAISEQFIEDGLRSPERPAFFALVMLLYTRNGQCYTIGEARQLCLDAGLAEHSSWRLTDTDSIIAFWQKPA